MAEAEDDQEEAVIHIEESNSDYSNGPEQDPPTEWEPTASAADFIHQSGDGTSHSEPWPPAEDAGFHEMEETPMPVVTSPLPPAVTIPLAPVGDHLLRPIVVQPLPPQVVEVFFDGERRHRRNEAFRSASPD
ncbi:hypothetical protein V5799_034272, partial [Amblyomma americanum]